MNKIVLTPAKYIEKNILEQAENFQNNNQQIEVLEKLLSKIINDESQKEFSYKLGLDLSKLYFIQAIWLQIAAEDSYAAYNIASMGYGYLLEVKNHMPDSDRCENVVQWHLRYIFLFNFIPKPPQTHEIIAYEIVTNNGTPRPITPPESLNELIIVLTQLYELQLINEDIAAYEGFIAITGCQGALSLPECAAFMSDSLSRLSSNHPCYQGLDSIFQRRMSQLRYFSDLFNSRFVHSTWGIQAIYSLFDHWMLDKIKNKYLFKPARMLQSVNGITSDDP